MYGKSTLFYMARMPSLWRSVVGDAGGKACKARIVILARGSVTPQGTIRNVRN